MSFEFFFFLLFMSIISFIVAFLAYGMVVRCMGKTGTASRWAQIILVPLCVIFFDFICIAAPIEYRYWIGSIPLVLVGCILLYFYFFKGESFTGEQTPTEAAAANKPYIEEKKFSKKSQRIHEARKKRGGK